MVGGGTVGIGAGITGNGRNCGYCIGGGVAVGLFVGESVGCRVVGKGVEGLADGATLGVVDGETLGPRGSYQ